MVDILEFKFFYRLDFKELYFIKFFVFYWVSNVVLGCILLFNMGNENKFSFVFMSDNLKWIYIVIVFLFVLFLLFMRSKIYYDFVRFVLLRNIFKDLVYLFLTI